MQDLVSDYMVPFQTCIQKAQASGLMCSYNGDTFFSVNSLSHVSHFVSLMFLVSSLSCFSFPLSFFLLFLVFFSLFL